MPSRNAATALEVSRFSGQTDIVDVQLAQGFPWAYFFGSTVDANYASVFAFFVRFSDTAGVAAGLRPKPLDFARADRVAA